MNLIAARAENRKQSLNDYSSYITEPVSVEL